jgi:hypothetical protein
MRLPCSKLLRLLPVLLSLSTLAGRLAAQPDTALLKPGASWKYAYETRNENTGSLESGFKGTSLFTVESAHLFGADSAIYTVNRVDSGTTTKVGVKTGITEITTRYRYIQGAFHTVANGTDAIPPFLSGRTWGKPQLWAVLGADTLPYATEPPLDYFTCQPTGYGYLETVGMVRFTHSAHCGITSQLETYALIARNGNAFDVAKVKVLPVTRDFAPYSLGAFWEYRTLSLRSQSDPIFHSTYSSTDTLLWTFQVSGLSHPGMDSLIEFHVQATHPNGSVFKAYTDTAKFARGAWSPVWQGYNGGEYPKFLPLYESHGAVLEHPAPGQSAGDTLINGSVRKILRTDPKAKVPDSRPNTEWKADLAYVQGIGLAAKEYGGSSQIMASQGMSIWQVSVRLLATGIRPVGLGPQVRGPGRARTPGMRTGSAALLFEVGGIRFGADGKRRSPR